MELKVLQEAVKEIKGTQFISLDTISSVTLRGGKKNPMQGRVQKRTVGSNVMIVVSDESAYANMVRKRLVKEGKDPADWQPKPRAWGTHVKDTPFIVHKDKYYLECIFMHAGKSTYLLDGEPIEKESVEGLEEPKVSEESQGSLEEKVIIRTYSVDSIEKLRIGGKELE